MILKTNCKNIEFFSNKKSAEWFIKINKTFNNYLSGFRTMKAYKCRECDKWHVGEGNGNKI